MRDVNTLKLIRMAPIYDTGRAFGGYYATPYTDDEIHEIEVNSFKSTEKELLKLVRKKNARDIIDPDKIPSPDFIEKLYLKDSKQNSYRIDSILHLYEKKKELLSQFLIQ